MEDFVIKLINKNSGMVEYEFYSKKDLEKKYKEGFEAGRKFEAESSQKNETDKKPINLKLMECYQEGLEDGYENGKDFGYDLGAESVLDALNSILHNMKINPDWFRDELHYFIKGNDAKGIKTSEDFFFYVFENLGADEFLEAFSKYYWGDPDEDEDDDEDESWHDEKIEDNTISGRIVLAPDNSKIVVMNIDKKENTYTGFDIATGKKVSGKWDTVKPIGKILCRYYGEEDNNG